MSRFLILDVGAGTLDLLFYDSSTGGHYKAVCRSPILTAADSIRAMDGDLLVTGCEMGGGGVTAALKEKAKNREVVMSASAAATVHHDLNRVRSHGIRVVDDEEAESLRDKGIYNHMVTRDLDPERLRMILDGIGVRDSIDVIGVCAQDHGVAPEGVSHLDFRHNLFRSALDRNASLEGLLYSSDRIPGEFNRLKSIARTAKDLQTREIYVMDSGMAAILGASLDPFAAAFERILALDVATSHTVGAVLEKGELGGFFEYHTSDITLNRLEKLLVDLADGTLDHAAVLADGGHGAYVRKVVGFDNIEYIVATGPKRGLLGGSCLSIRPGAPLGDNMMTGTLGVLEAVHRAKGLGPVHGV